MLKIVFTLCSNNYLAQAKTLGDSLLKNNPDYHFFIGLVDKRSPEVNYEQVGHQIIEVNKIPIPNLDWMMENYNIVEFNTAVKPFLFDHLIQQYHPEQIYFFDPDIEVFRSLDPVERYLVNDDIVLTPHVTSPIPREVYPWENHYLNNGLYNLGFIGLKPTDNALKLIDWWKDRCSTHCKSDYINGLYVDQLWANYFPLYFDKVRIAKDPGFNVAFWNLHERILSKKGDVYWVNGSYELVFFHYSSFHPLAKKDLAKEGYSNYKADKDKILLELLDGYSQKLTSNGYNDLIKVKSYYSALTSRKFDEDALINQIQKDEKLLASLKFRFIHKERLVKLIFELLMRYMKIANHSLSNNVNDHRYNDVRFANKKRKELIRSMKGSGKFDIKSMWHSFKKL